MSKTEGYSWIVVVVGGIIGLVLAVMLDKVVEAELMVVLNCGLAGFVIGWFVGDISNDEDIQVLIVCILPLIVVVIFISIIMYCLDTPRLAGYEGLDIIAKFITWLGRLFIGLVIGAIVSVIIGTIAFLISAYNIKGFCAIFCAIIGLFVSDAFADSSVATIPIFIIPIFAVIGYFAWAPLAVMLEAKRREQKRREQERKRVEEEKRREEEEKKQRKAKKTIFSKRESREKNNIKKYYFRDFLLFSGDNDISN